MTDTVLRSAVEAYLKAREAKDKVGPLCFDVCNEEFAAYVRLKEALNPVVKDPIEVEVTLEGSST